MVNMPNKSRNPQKQDAKDIKSNLVVLPLSDPSFVVAVVIHSADYVNELKRIPCEKGTVIGGYVYDTINKCYLVKCYDMHTIGVVGISFQLSIKNGDNWQVEIPTPPLVLKRYLDSSQKSKLKHWENKFQKGEFTFQYIQIMSSN